MKKIAISTIIICLVAVSMMSGCASYDKQIDSIARVNEQNAASRRQMLDNLFQLALATMTSAEQKKLVEIPKTDKTPALIVYRYDSDMPQIAKMIDSMVTNQDIQQFPTHPLILGLGEIRQLVDNPTTRLVGGLWMGGKFVEKIGENAGHNTTMTSGGDMGGTGGASVANPITTTTETVTTNTETVTNPGEWE